MSTPRPKKRKPVSREIVFPVMTKEMEGLRERLNQENERRLKLMVKVRELVRSGRRVCPQPRHWNKFWELLPDRKRVGIEWEPPPPLILAVWHIANDAQKRERFWLHICWGVEHGAIDQIAAFLDSLTPNQWHYEK